MKNATPSRRSFLQRSGLLAGGVVSAATLSTLGAHMALAHDAVGGSGDDTHPLAPGIDSVNRLIGLGTGGGPFEFAVNVVSESEFAGAVFSPDGEILFVNLQGGDTPGTGMTMAIWGPWERGPL